MKTILAVSIFLLAASLSSAQSTFWIVKGGTGEEVGTYRSAHLDTTSAGSLLWLYNSSSTTSGVNDIVMEVWPKGASSPVTELFLGSTNFVRLLNLQTYEDELYLSTALVNPSVSGSETRAGLIRLDTHGIYQSSFMFNGSQMSNYGNAYECAFIQDTAYLVGQARSGPSSNNREDFLLAKLNLADNSSLLAKRWNGYGTERIRSIVSSKTGDSLFAAAYSYNTPSSSTPILFHFDRQGNIVQDYTYGISNSAFSSIERTDSDSLLLLGGNHSDIYFLLAGLNGQVGKSKRFSSSSGALIRNSGIKQYGNQLLFFGYVSNEAAGNGGDEGFLMAIDRQGTVLWAKLYGGSGNENFTDLQIVSDGFYLTGKTNTSIQGGYDVMLLKTDFNGNISQPKPCFNIVSYTSNIISSNMSFLIGGFSPTSTGSLTGFSGQSMASIPSTMLNDNCNVLVIEDGEEDALSQMTEKYQLSAYPNPVKEFLTIPLPQTQGQVQIELIDQNGEIIRKERLTPEQQEKSWNLSTLPRGMYLLQLHWFESNDIKVFHQKLVVT